MADQKLHRSEFIRRMVAQFPEMKARSRDLHDGIHSEVGAFRDFIQEAIDSARPDVVERCFRFVAASLVNPNEEVRNALADSLLEDLDLRGPARRFAVNLLPDSVRAAREAVLGYYQQLTGKFRWGEEAALTAKPPSRKRKRGAA